MINSRVDLSSRRHMHDFVGIQGTECSTVYAPTPSVCLISLVQALHPFSTLIDTVALFLRRLAIPNNSADAAHDGLEPNPVYAGMCQSSRFYVRACATHRRTITPPAGHDEQTSERRKSG